MRPLLEEANHSPKTGVHVNLFSMWFSDVQSAQGDTPSVSQFQSQSLISQGGEPYK